MTDIIFVDGNDAEIGSGSLKEALDRGVVRRVSRVILVNDKDEILLQRRGDVVSYPGLWNDSASGHVDVGETYLEAAYREMKEEMGVEGVRLQEVGKFYGEEKEGEITRKAFNELYKGEFSGTPVIDTDEVSDFKWISKDKLKRWIDEKPHDFTPGSVAAIRFYLKKQ